MNFADKIEELQKELNDLIDRGEDLTKKGQRKKEELIAELKAHYTLMEAELDRLTKDAQGFFARNKYYVIGAGIVVLAAIIGIVLTV